MKEIIIEPHIGIGQLKLGMTSDELENALLEMKKILCSSEATICLKLFGRYLMLLLYVVVP